MLSCEKQQTRKVAVKSNRLEGGLSVVLWEWRINRINRYRAAGVTT